MTYVTGFFILGLILLIIDLLFIGVNVLVFIGLGAISTSLIAFLGVFPENDSTFMYLIGVWGISSAAITALLWKPMKALQNKTYKSDTSSDIIGKNLKITSPTTKTVEGKVRFSGVDWNAKADPDFIRENDILEKGMEVEVTQVRGNVLWVNK